MDREGLQSFFDLGNSLRRGDPKSIGEKGHGTKVYFNSNRIEVTTTNEDYTLYALMEDPVKKLYDRKIPEVFVEETPQNGDDGGTRIRIEGYNNSRRDKFTHNNVKDYILWFTKFGSIERIFNINTYSDVILKLKGLDRSDFETISFGHIFPPESASVQQLFDSYMVKAPDHYCKRIVKQGHLKNFPEIEYHAVFSIEGNYVKYDSNDMIRRRGYQSPRGAYQIQERYGLWLCKDFIPIQRKNEWITTKGSEFTKFHAFFNCQHLNLTANRGSVDNTPSEIIDDIEYVVREMYESIITSEDWSNIEWLEAEVVGYQTEEKERKEFEKRVSRAKRANIAEIRVPTDSMYEKQILVEPQRESGVFALLIQLNIHYPDLFPFQILEYDTHSGIDVIVKRDDANSIDRSRLYYVELKYYLVDSFNHTFRHLHSIVCWDTDLTDGDEVVDLSGAKRIMRISPVQNNNEYTRYFLDDPNEPHKIEVYVLKDYLKEKLGIEFRPRPRI